MELKVENKAFGRGDDEACRYGTGRDRISPFANGVTQRLSMEEQLRPGQQVKNIMSYSGVPWSTQNAIAVRLLRSCLASTVGLEREDRKRDEG